MAQEALVEVVALHFRHLFGRGACFITSGWATTSGATFSEQPRRGSLPVIGTTSPCRAGREAEAQSWLATLPANLPLIENDDYLALLRLFRGELKAEVLLSGKAGGVPGATLGYGIAVDHLLAGRTQAATAAFEQLVAGETWAAFGHLAAEAELARRAKSGP